MTRRQSVCGAMRREEEQREKPEEPVSGDVSLPYVGYIDANYNAPRYPLRARGGGSAQKPAITWPTRRCLQGSVAQGRTGITFPVLPSCCLIASIAKVAEGAAAMPSKWRQRAQNRAAHLHSPALGSHKSHTKPPIVPMFILSRGLGQDCRCALKGC